MQGLTSSIYTSIIPVSDMTPLSGIPNLYNYDTLISNIYFKILPSAIQNNLVCVVAQPDEDSNTGTALLFNTTTQTIISSISLSGNIYSLYNYSQTPSLIEIGNNKYCVLDGYDPDYETSIISITDFSSKTVINSASILSIYNNNVVYTDFDSSTPIISSINVETKAVTNLSWINDAHNEQSKLIMVYETASNYVTINPTTYQVICFDKNTKNVTSTFNISAVSNAPSLSGVTALSNKNNQKIDYYLTDDKQKVYIKCGLLGESSNITFILYVDPSNISNCNIIASTISLNAPLELSDYSILISNNSNILVKYVMGGVGNRNAVLYQLDKYNIEHIISIPISNYEQFTTLTNGMIYSRQPVQGAPHPFIYSIIKAGEYIGIWPKAAFLRLRLLGYF